MSPYATRTGRRALQIVADVLTVATIVVAVWLGTVLHDAVEGYRSMGESVADSAAGVASDLDDAGDQLAGVGFDAGIFEWNMPDAVTAPLYSAADAVREIEQAGNDTADAVSRTADAVRAAISLPPLVFALALWALTRGRWIRLSGQLRALAATDAGREVLAVRAAASARPRDLVDAGVSPLSALRDGSLEDIDTLAAIAMRDAGLDLPERERRDA